MKLRPTLKNVLAAFSIALVTGVFGWWAGLVWWESFTTTIQTASVLAGVLCLVAFNVSVRLLTLCTKISELHTRSSDWGAYIFALAVVPIVVVHPLLMASANHVVRLF